jgi:hypothetical protein
MLWDDEALFTKQRAPTLKNNIYLNPTNHGYNGNITKPSTTTTKKFNVTTNLKQFDE